MAPEDDPAQAPLDPATERVRRKMVRLLGVSIGIMFIGVMAVLAAVVYRTTEVREPVIEAGASVPFVLPSGSEIIETTLDGDTAMLRLALAEGGEELVLFDRRNGAVLSRHPLTRP